MKLLIKVPVLDKSSEGKEKAEPKGQEKKRRELMQNQRGKQNRRMKKWKEKTDYDRDEKYYNHEPQPVYDFTNIKLSCFGTS